jgi:hypothetical protein
MMLLFESRAAPQGSSGGYPALALVSTQGREVGVAPAMLVPSAVQVSAEANPAAG